MNEIKLKILRLKNRKNKKDIWMWVKKDKIRGKKENHKEGNKIEGKFKKWLIKNEGRTNILE